MYPMVSKAASFNCSLLDWEVTLSTSLGIRSGHCCRGISAHAMPAITCAADEGRLVSVPKASKTCKSKNYSLIVKDTKKYLL